MFVDAGKKRDHASMVLKNLVKYKQKMSVLKSFYKWQVQNKNSIIDTLNLTKGLNRSNIEDTESKMEL